MSIRLLKRQWLYYKSSYKKAVFTLIETQPEILAFVVKAQEWILSSVQVLEKQKHDYEDYVERLGYTPKTAADIIEMLNH